MCSGSRGVGVRMLLHNNDRQRPGPVAVLINKEVQKVLAVFVAVHTLIHIASNLRRGDHTSCRGVRVTGPTPAPAGP